MKTRTVYLNESKSKTLMINATATLYNRRIMGYEAGLNWADRACFLTTYQWWKMCLDRILSLLAIVTMSPLMAVIALGIRIDSPGKVIFRREQIGENGRRFFAYKFRTMYANNDDAEYKKYITRYVTENAPYSIGPDGKPVYKVTDDPRVTRFGRLLRKTNLDELPQFFNVLKGEMSLVGPRPDIPFAVAMYKDWHRKRLSVKPGITGLWQVCQRYGLPFEGMVRLDILYIKRQSLMLDAKILLLTVATIVRRDGC
jgi:lipopolysaccharide/colanic/teichoic acid biosynthesis glycosyltransferase